VSQEDEIIVHCGKAIMVVNGDPNIIYFFKRDCEGGFLGQTDDGQEWIGINLGDVAFSYTASLHPKCVVLWLNYVTLHELTHWATESENGHKNWLRFLMKLLLELEDVELKELSEKC
jgi:hypothetical protein